MKRKKRKLSLLQRLKQNKLKFPIMVHKIVYDIDRLDERGMGDWVSVRPCADEFKSKTYLGIYMGDIPIYSGASLRCRTKRGKPRKRNILKFYHTGGNPMIYIPDMKKVVYGYNSWWGRIRSPDDLKNISDKDINNVWYVRALKELDKKREDKN